MDLSAIEFNDQGLVVAIAQDAASDEILMVAYMNAESLLRTLETGEMVYWSRSRGKLWHKGEESGHVQRVREFRIDCDGDALLFKVEQAGGACHTGYRSCFYRRHEDGAWVEDGTRAFDPKAVYKK
jgi:phosphoribosyl-AMP cyclohydrolase